MIREATAEDAAFLEEVVGLDPRPAMNRCITLVSDDGGFFLEPITETVFEAHMFFAPESRGKKAIKAAREGLLYMFQEKGALVIFGRIPLEDRAARLMTRWVGFKAIGIRPKFDGGELVEWFEMTRDRCLQQQQ